MGEKLNAMIAKAEKEQENKPLAKPRTSHCTGCDEEFTEDVYVDVECPDCGYLACESCACHHSRGMFSPILY